jgi:hypothetical protein
MVQENNEIITIGSLRSILREEFVYLHTYLDTHFEGIYKRFDDIDLKFIEIDKKFDAIDVRFDGIDKEIRGINSRLDFTNRRIDNHLEDCVRQEQHHRLENRVLKLEKA